MIHIELLLVTNKQTNKHVVCFTTMEFISFDNVLLTMSGRCFLSSFIFLSLLLIDHSSGGFNCTTSLVMCRSSTWNSLALDNSVTLGENRILVGFWTLPLESSSHGGWSLNNKTNDGGHSVLFTWALTPSAVTYRTCFRISRHMRPCLYYSNSTSTFHPMLIGDLIFKLNPGSVNGTIPTICSVRGYRRRCGSLRQPQNLINVNCSDPNTRTCSNLNHPLSLCL